MRTLKALTILTLLGAGGGATEGAPLDDAAGQPASSAGRPGLPKPAAEYLKAAAYLQNSGNVELAQKYLKVAYDYRDELTPAEKTVLDEYVRVMRFTPTPASVTASPSSPRFEPTPPSSMVQASASTPMAPAPRDAAVGITPADAASLDASQTMTLDGRTGTVDAKQKARWLLANAMELSKRGQFDEASAKVAEARALNAKWTLFEDTPDKVARVIEKARSKTGATAASAGAVAAGTAAPDKGLAKARLKQARDLLNANQYDQAEAVAREVDRWNLPYSFWEETPAKVIASARALRQRDAARKAPTINRPSVESYEAMVAEARRLLAIGQFEAAEAKAVQAQRLGVIPAVTADRAESVLGDIAQLRGQSLAAGAEALASASTAPPMTESASSRIEREADALLARNDHQAAAAKYAEAERLRAQEMGRAIATQPMFQPPPADGAVRPAVSSPGMPADAAPLPPPMEPIPNLPSLPSPTPAEPIVAIPPMDELAEDAGMSAEKLLQQARQLFDAGNFAAARETANRAGTMDAAIKAAADELAQEIAVRQQGAALALYEEALAAVRNKEFEHARVLLNEVAASGSLEEGLQQRVQDLLLKIRSTRSGDGPIEAQADADLVAAQRLNAEVAVKVGESRRLMDIDPDRAIQTLQETLTAVKAAEVPEAARRQMVRRLEVALELAQKDKVAFDLKMQDKNARIEVEQKKLRILEADKAKKARMKEYMEKAQAAMADARYDEAESWALRAQEVDPNDVAATAMAWKARAQRGYERDRENRRLMDAGVVASFQSVDEAGIVDPSLLKNAIAFPRSFPELTRMRRESFARLDPKADPMRMAVERKLGEPVTIDMDKQPLSEAVTFLQNATGLNVMLDPKALLETGLTDATPVSMRLKDVRLKTALKLMLQPLGLTYQIEDDVLLITTPQNNAKMIEKVYPVGDLVLPANRGANQKFGTQLPMAGSATDPNTAVDPAAAPASASDTKVTPIDFQNLDFSPIIQVITSSVAPGTWKVFDGKGGMMPIESGMAAYGMGAGFGAGGGGLDDTTTPPPGSIIPYFLNISLIIRHTPEVHDEVVELLRQLRKLQDLQVSVEVRFITLSDNFFERIGIDFDFAIQSDVEAKKNAFATRNPAAVPIVPGANAQPVGPYLVPEAFDHSLGREPVTVGVGNAANTIGIPRLARDLKLPFLQDSFNLTNPFNAISGAGATFGVAFLSDLEVYLFVEAAQGDTRSNLVAAPKVTSFNGATASVFNARVVNYVASLLPVVNFGAVAFQPTPAQIFDGVFLTVIPVVSADRRYVRLTLSPTFQTIDGFDTFPVPAAVGGGGIGGGSAAITGQIQLPRTTISNVDTTVTVPDGGTVLLGGLKRLREEPQEFGVPILAKTPLINRLFRNIGIGRQTDSLMIMVTPRIIILEEEEERLGIPALAPTNP